MTFIIGNKYEIIIDNIIPKGIKNIKDNNILIKKFIVCIYYSYL